MGQCQWCILHRTSLASIDGGACCLRSCECVSVDARRSCFVCANTIEANGVRAHKYFFHLHINNSYSLIMLVQSMSAEKWSNTERVEARVRARIICGRSHIDCRSIVVVVVVIHAWIHRLCIFISILAHTKTTDRSASSSAAEQHLKLCVFLLLSFFLRLLGCYCCAVK